MEVESFSTLVVAMTGLPGVGTTTVARRISERTPYELDPRLVEFRSIHTLRLGYLLRLDGYQPPASDLEDLAGMREYHRNVRQAGRGADIFDQMSSLQENIILFEKIRHPADAAHIKRRGGFLVSAVAPEATCDQRYMADTSDTKHADGAHSSERATALAMAKQEITPQDNDPYASDILSCMDMADVRVSFEGDLAATEARIVTAIRNIGLHYIDAAELITDWPANE
jgi:hypothetical protein